MPSLILQDGTVLKGTAFGADVDSEGEVVFNTGMVGYPESLTDPSYCGQILTLTYPLIGNYGVPGKKKDHFGIPSFFESGRMQIRGLVVSEYSENISHWQAAQTLGAWMKEQGIPGITGIDTRMLTQKLREHGVLLGQIRRDGKRPEKTFNDPNATNLVAEVSIKKPIVYKGGKKRVVVIDCGMKNNILRSFMARNATVIRVPWNFDFWNSDYKFDGVFISNGPGDPAVLTETAALLKKCFEKNIPTFGICLGNQIMSIAAGGRTYKLKYGHRAQNQPCMDLVTKRCYLTSQNHGFAVDRKSLPKSWITWFENINDKTVEGVRHKTKPFFAVQFHPEATPGPTDTGFLFDEFLKML